MRKIRRWKPMLAAILAAWLYTPMLQAAARVELDLVAEPGLPVTDQQKWLQFFSGMDLRVRIRSATGRFRPEIQQQGQGESTSYKVTGIITARRTVLLPEGEFRMGDRAGISKWLAKLRDGGQQRLQETEGVFGLTPTQLLEVNRAISKPLTFPTKGKTAFEVLYAAAGLVTCPFTADTRATQVMRQAGPVADELTGLSAGTAMVAVLRPLGLVLVPRRDAGKLTLLITDVRNADESWPVGWPLQEAPREVAPELFQYLNVEIADRPLRESLEAVRERLEMPLLFDYNSLARHRIDPDATLVSLPAKRMYYQQIIDRLLNQAQLKSEVRVDEAGSPFLWVSTLRP